MEIRDLSEEEFQTMFEACGDSDPLGLMLDGQVIGLVNVRYDKELRARLSMFGIHDVTR